MTDGTMSDPGLGRGGRMSRQRKREAVLRLLREEGVSFQAVKTWKESNDPDFEVKKNRILELYDIAGTRLRVETVEQSWVKRGPTWFVDAEKSPVDADRPW